MKCEEVAPEIEAYAIGALPPEEMNAIEKHLKNCADCHSLLERYNLTLESLALEAASYNDTFEPPAGHKERFMAKLSERSQLRPGSNTAEELAEAAASKRSNRVPARARNRGWFGRFAPAAFSLMLVAVIALGLWSWNLASELDQQQTQNKALAVQIARQNLDLNDVKNLNAQLLNQKDDLASQVSALSGERDNLKEQVSQLNSIEEKARLSQSVSLLLTKPGATTRTATTDQAGITVLMAPDEKDVALIAQSWPQLKEGQEYRVWLYHTTGALVSVGALKLSPLTGQNLAETLINVPEPMSNYTTLFITIEKPGVQSPTGPEIIRDKLA